MISIKTEILKSYRRKDPLIVLAFLFFVVFFLVFRINTLEDGIGRYESNKNMDVASRISSYYGKSKLGEDYKYLKEIEKSLSNKAIAESNIKSSDLDVLNARITYDEKVAYFSELGKNIEAFYPGDPELYMKQNNEIKGLGYGYVRANSYNTPMQALHKLSSIYLGVPAVMFFVLIFVLIMKEMVEDHMLEKTMPIAWIKIVLRKFILFLAYILIYLILFSLVVFIIYHLKGRPLGEFDYPVLIEKTGTISKIWKVVLFKQLYFALYLLATLTVFFLFLKIFGEMRISMVLITMLLYMLNVLSQNARIDIYSPMAYLSIENGWMLTEKSVLSIIFILIFIIVVAILNYILKDIRIGLFKTVSGKLKLKRRSLILNDLNNKLSGSLIWILLFALGFGVVVDQVSGRNYLKTETAFLSDLKNDVVMKRSLYDSAKEQTLARIKELKENNKTKSYEEESQRWNLLDPHLNSIYNDAAERLVAYNKKSPTEFYKQQNKSLDIAAKKDTYDLVVDKKILFSFDVMHQFDDTRYEYAKTQLKYIEDRNLPPTSKALEVFHFHNDEEVIECYDKSAVGYYLYAYREYLVLVMVLAALILTGGGFTKKTKDDNSELFYNLMPIKKSYIYFVSWIGSVIKSSIVYICIQILPFLGLSVIYGIGEGRYPVFNYMGKSGSFEWMPRSEVLLQYFVLGLLILLFLQSLSNLLSLRVKNTYLNSILTVGIVRLGFYFSRQFLSNPFNPFIYLNPGDIVNNKYASLVENIDISFYKGCITLIIISVLLLIIGCMLYSRKERRRI